MVDEAKEYEEEDKKMKQRIEAKNSLENYCYTLKTSLEDEANKYANILGYNYNSSEWFAQSYKILNKDYKIKKSLSKKEKFQKDESFFKRILKMMK